MKTLILLRHATAGPYQADDHGRELTECGQTEARQGGGWLRERGYRPDFYICSTSMRTRQTLAEALESAGYDLPGEMLETLYNHQSTDYIRDIRQQDAGIEVLLVVGHNPDICQLTASLANSSNPVLVDQIIMSNYPKGAIAVLRANISSWQDLRLRSAELVDWFIPQ